MPVLERMAKIGLPLCVHGEVTTPEVDIFDREKVFIDTVLEPLRQRLPELKVTMEHITTRDGVDYIKSSRPIWLAPSLLTISSSTATPFWLAVSSRIIIACPSPSAKNTGWRCGLPRHRAMRASSSARIPPRMWTR